MYRRPDALDDGRRGNRRALAAALPHEFNPYHKVHKRRTRPQNESDLSSNDFMYDFDTHKFHRIKSISEGGVLDNWMEAKN